MLSRVVFSIERSLFNIEVVVVSIVEEEVAKKLVKVKLVKDWRLTLV